MTGTVQSRAVPSDSASSPGSGDFDAIFRAEYSYVFNSLRRLGVRDADLPDLTHEVFLVVHKRLDGYDRSRPIRPWLFGIAFRSASDYRRLARHEREQSQEEVHAVDGALAADDQILRQQAQRILLRILDGLDVDQRAVLILHEIDGEPVPEIARALGIPLNTAYSRLRLARAEFSRAVERKKKGFA